MGNDYQQPQSNSVTFNKTEDTKQICVTVINDRDLEDDQETFHLEIVNNTLPFGVFRKQYTSITVAIEDDECKYMFRLYFVTIIIIIYIQLHISSKKYKNKIPGKSSQT